jgi:BlaI family penicillinase repressor
LEAEHVARTPQDVTGAELAVLRVLWERGPATRRQLTDVLYPDGGPAHFTTVQKLLERLEAKGYVSSERGGSAVAFRATVDREELLSRRLQDVADTLCEGSLTPLMTNLIRAGQLSGKQLDELRALLDELKRPPFPKGKRR